MKTHNQKIILNQYKPINVKYKVLCVQLEDEKRKLKSNNTYHFCMIGVQ